MQIDYLSNHSELIPIVARWHHHEWGHLRAEKAIEWRSGQFIWTNDPSAIPLTFTACSESGPMGTASLVLNDIPERQDLSPWLASVYVQAEYRKQGIGSVLVNQVVGKANSLNHPILYLFTFDKMKLYWHLDWKTIEQLDYHGHEIIIMDIETHKVTHNTSSTT